MVSSNMRISLRIFGHYNIDQRDYCSDFFQSTQTGQNSS